MSEKKFWIEVSLETDEMQTRLDTLLDICHEIYLWTLDTAAELWIEHKGVPKTSSLGKQLTKKIKSSSRYRQVQRYTLNRVVEHALAQFNRELEINEETNQITFPKPILRDSYTAFMIPARGIWKKYLEEFSRISTAYGMFYLQGEWKETFKQQAKAHRVTMGHLPYLWHSVTIQKTISGWQIHFNLHIVDSHRGKIAQKKMERERFKAL